MQKSYVVSEALLYADDTVLVGTRVERLQHLSDLVDCTFECVIKKLKRVLLLCLMPLLTQGLNHH